MQEKKESITLLEIHQKDYCIQYCLLSYKLNTRLSITLDFSYAKRSRKVLQSSKQPLHQIVRKRESVFNQTVRNVEENVMYYS